MAHIHRKMGHHDPKSCRCPAMERSQERGIQKWPNISACVCTKLNITHSSLELTNQTCLCLIMQARLVGTNCHVGQTPRRFPKTLPNHWENQSPLSITLMQTSCTTQCRARQSPDASTWQTKHQSCGIRRNRQQVRLQHAELNSLPDVPAWNKSLIHKTHFDTSESGWTTPVTCLETTNP